MATKAEGNYLLNTKFPFIIIEKILGALMFACMGMASPFLFEGAFTVITLVVTLVNVVMVITKAK